MADSSAKSELAAVLMMAASESRSISAIEQDVLDLFDALREGLARYVMSFALQVPDAEDV
jgi:hypothetical protein